MLIIFHKELISSIQGSLARDPDPILKGETINSLHNHIIARLDLILHQKGIQIPDEWTTYRLLKKIIVNDPDLFHNIEFLLDLVDDLAHSENSCWVEAGIEFIKFFF